MYNWSRDPKDHLRFQWFPGRAPRTQRDIALGIKAGYSERPQLSLTRKELWGKGQEKPGVKSQLSLCWICSVVSAVKCDTVGWQQGSSWELWCLQFSEKGWSSKYTVPMWLTSIHTLHSRSKWPSWSGVQIPPIKQDFVGSLGSFLELLNGLS